jgi:hypothetical protein
MRGTHSAYMQGTEGWRTLYDVDFTSLVAADLTASGDGDYTIDGRTWTTVNTSEATTLDLHSSGLRIFPDATNTAWGRPSTATAPHLYIKATLQNEFSFTQLGSVIVLLDITHNANLATEEGGIAMLDTIDSTAGLAATIGHTSAAVIRQFRDTTAGAVATTSTRDTLGIQYFPTTLNAYYGDMTGAAFPRVWSGYTNSGRNVSSTISPTTGTSELGTATRLHLFAAPNNTGGNTQFTFTRMRILLLDGAPP